MTYHNTQNMRLEVEVPTEGLPNLVQNPSGDLGTWGWVTPVANTTMTANDGLTFKTNVSQAAHFKTEHMSLLAGKYVSARIDLKAITAGHNIKARFEFYDNTKTLLSSSTQTGAMSATQTQYVPAVVAPANTEYVALRFDLYNGTGNPSAGAEVYFNKAMVTYADTAAEIQTIRQNLIPNPSFEQDLVGWRAYYNDTIVRSTAQAYAGSASVILTAKAEGQAAMSTVVPVVGGRTYTASIYSKAATTPRRFWIAGYWLDAQGNVLTSFSNFSTPNSTTEWTRNTNTITAPSSAVSVRLIVSVGTTTAGSGYPEVGEQHYFDAVMLEEGTTATAYFDGSSSGGSWKGSTIAATNLIPNPSFESNVNGFTPAFGGPILSRSTTQAYTGSASMLIEDNGVGAQFSEYLVEGPTLPLTASTYYKTHIAVYAPFGNRRFSVRLYDSDRSTFIDLIEPTDLTPGTWTVLESQYYVYAGALDYNIFTLCIQNSAGQVFDHGAPIVYVDSIMVADDAGVGYFTGATTDTPTRTYDWTGTAHNSTSTLTVPTYSEVKNGDYDYVDPIDWQNILGPTHSISIERAELDVGLMNAEILDALLDPAVADTIRPGKRIRLVGQVDDEWTPVYTGKITNAYVTYPRAKRAGSKVETRIQITSSDNIATLANQGEGTGVQYLEDLAYILEGKGVPWNINGSGDQVTSATTVSWNENASVLDQVAITRDTNLGYTWVDRQNVLQVASSDLDETVAAAFSDIEGLGYTDIDVDFDLERCINHVQINWLRYDIGTDTTTEIPYGPYSNAESIAKWGARSATFTIHGATESPSAIADYANAILTANAEPKVKANSLTMPVRNIAEFSAAVRLDLYDKVSVVYSDKVNDTYRITGIKHTITPEKWSVEYTFGSDSSVAPPTWTPSPPFKGLTATEPYAYYEISSGTRNVSTGTWTKVTGWTNVEASGIAFGSNTWTIENAGRYVIKAKTAYPNNSSGNRYLRIMVNGSQVSYNISSANSSASTFVSAEAEIRLNIGDTIEIETHQNSGTTLALMTNAGYTQTFIRKIGD